MGSLEFNKFAGALLGSFLFIMALGILTNDIVFKPVASALPGFDLPEAEGDEHGGGETVVAKIETSIAEFLLDADVAKGQKAFKKCAACHTADEGGANKVGPNLYNIVGRTVANVAGFSYSSAALEWNSEGRAWSYEDLAAFLAKPKDFLKGTKMGFAGMKKGKDRANMLAYLQTLSATPVEFPAFVPMETEAGEEASTEEPAETEAAD